MNTLNGRVLVPGVATGTSLPLSAPISFWGGVDPNAGTICDPRHPDIGKSITDKVLVVPATIGSSSSSAILLELLRQQNAPAAILLGSIDAILVLGVLVAGELGYPTIPVIEQAAENLAAIPLNATVTVTTSGEVVWD